MKSTNSEMKSLLNVKSKSVNENKTNTSNNYNNLIDKTASTSLRLEWQEEQLWDDEFAAKGIFKVCFTIYKKFMFRRIFVNR